MAKETVPMIYHVQLQMEANELNKKYQNLRQEAIIMCDEIQLENNEYTVGMMASFRRLCKLLGR